MAYIGNTPGVSSQRFVNTYNLTASTTTFTPSNGYALGYVDVYLNGVKLVAGTDFTAADGNYVTLTDAALSGDVVEIVSFKPRGLSDGYTKSEADARYMDINEETLPDQSGHNGQFLQTNGTTADWAAVTQTQSDVHAFYINSSGELIWVHGSDVTELQDDNQDDIYELVIFGNDDQTFSLNADGYLIVTN